MPRDPPRTTTRFSFSIDDLQGPKRRA
jgi:hypothetical protein